MQLLIPLQNPRLLTCLLPFSLITTSSTMASRCRAFSRPAISLLKSTISKPSSTPLFSIPSTRASPSLFSRPMPQMGALQSLLPLYTAVSSARLTSCLGIDTNCRSLSQGMLCSANPGV